MKCHSRVPTSSLLASSPANGRPLTFFPNITVLLSSYQTTSPRLSRARCDIILHHCITLETNIAHLCAICNETNGNCIDLSPTTVWTADIHPPLAILSSPRAEVTLTSGQHSSLLRLGAATPSVSSWQPHHLPSSTQPDRVHHQPLD